MWKFDDFCAAAHNDQITRGFGNQITVKDRMWAQCPILLLRYVTVLHPSYLQNGIAYTEKTTSF